MTNTLLAPEQIKAARALINWTQQDLSRELGLTAASIANMESGKTNISIEQMHIIIQIFAKQNIEFIEGGVKQVTQLIHTFNAYDGLKYMLDSMYEHCSSTQNHAVYLLNYDDEPIHKKLGEYKMFHVKRMLKLRKTNIKNITARASAFACSFIEYHIHSLEIPTNVILAVVGEQVFSIDLLSNSCVCINSANLSEFWAAVYLNLLKSCAPAIKPTVYFHDVG